eukprot:gene12020-5419_t
MEEEEERIEPSKDEVYQKSEQNEYNDDIDEGEWHIKKKKIFSSNLSVKFPHEKFSYRYYCAFQNDQNEKKMFFLESKNSWEFRQFKKEKKSLDLQKITLEERKLINNILNESFDTEDKTEIEDIKKRLENAKAKLYWEVYKELKSTLEKAIKKNRDKIISNGSVYHSCPGGEAENIDESQLDTLEREYKQEIGLITVEPFEKLGKFYLNDPRGEKQNHIFWKFRVDDERKKLDDDAKKKLRRPSSEFKNFKWVDEDTFKSDIDTYYNKKEFCKAAWN